MTQSDITIVGGGLIGLSSACLLARQGLQIDLIEATTPPPWDQHKISNRVSAINIATRNLLDSIGIWQSISDRRVTSYRRMQVWDSHSEARIEFDSREYAQAQLGWIVENNLITQTMLERLQQNYNVRIHFDSSVETVEAKEDSIKVGLSPVGTQITSGLIIAADGGHSKIRELVGIETRQESFHQDALVTTVRCEKFHQNTAFQCFTPTGPVAMLPLHDNHCSLVWSCDQTQSDYLMALDQANFNAELEQLFKQQLGALHILDQPLHFPLHNRHASSYIAPRVALVGDAAHVTHPLAGLGANIGLLDAAALAQTIEHATSRGKALGGQGVLRRYERWRKGENSLVLTAMKTFKNVFGSSNQTVRQLRHQGFSIANSFYPLKKELASYAMGLSGDLPVVCRSMGSADSFQ